MESPAVSAGCPSREELLAYTVGKADDATMERVSGHIEVCPTCQAALATLEDAGDPLIARLRRHALPASYAEDPHCAAALAKADAIQHAIPSPAASAAEASSRSMTCLEQLGDYQLLQKLGEGGMGAVYKACHTRLKRIVALKVVSKDRTDDPRAKARFQREIEAAGRVNHPNIVQAYDAREIDGVSVLVTEFVDGLDLSEVVPRTHPISIAEVCEMTRQAALGLQAIHEHHLVHRDIKPSNLMLARDGRIKILDLGLALLAVEQPGQEALTSAGYALGTMDYIAPEQVFESHRVDIRADIYSLGCTLYKLLTGHAPFAGTNHETPKQKMLAQLQELPAPILERRTDVPQGVADVLDRMLAKEPAARFATPAEVAEALEPFVIGADLVALLSRAKDARTESSADYSGSTVPQASSALVDTVRRVEAPPLADRPTRRRLRRVMVAAGLLGVIVLLGIILLISDPSGRQTRISVPEGSEVSVSADGEVAVKLPSRTVASARTSGGRDSANATALLRAASGPGGYSAVDDFSADANTDASTWSYRYKDNPIRDGNYPLLPDYDLVDGAWQPGCPQGWRVPAGVPGVSVNRTGADLVYEEAPFLWKNHAMLVHPGRTGPVVVSWLSPLSGTVDVRFFFRSMDSNGGDGIAWFVDRNAVNLAEGDLAPGTDSGPRLLAKVAVSAGDRLHFLVTPKKTFRFDSTELAAIVTPVSGSPVAVKNAGNTASGVSTNGKGVAGKHGSPLCSMAMVDEPATLDGIASWTIETIGHRGRVHSLAYSPDGKRLASFGQDGTVRVWDTVAGKLLRALVGAEDVGQQVAWSPDGMMLAAVSSSGPLRAYHVIQVWDAETGSFVRRRTVPSVGLPISAAWSPKGRQLVYPVQTKGVIWDLFSDQPQVLKSNPPALTGGFAWSPDGASLACGTSEGMIRLWDARSGTVQRAFPGKAWTTMAWSPDGALLAFANNELIEIWNLRSGIPYHRFSEDSACTGIAWSPDGRQLASVSPSQDRSGTIRLRDIVNGNLLFEKRVRGCRSLAYSPDGSRLAVGTDGGTILFFGTGTQDVQGSLAGHSGFVRSAGLAFSPDGSRLASRQEDAKVGVRVWDVKTGRLASQWPTRADSSAMAWSPDAKLFVEGGDDGVTLWDLGSNRRIGDLPGQRELQTLTFTPDGKKLLVTGKEAKIWDLATRRVLCEIVPWERGAAWPVFSPDGRTLAGAAKEGVILYDANSGRSLQPVEGPRQSPHVLAWSPDSKILAAAFDSRIDFWEREQPGAGSHWLPCGIPIDAMCWLSSRTLAMGGVLHAFVYDHEASQVVRMVPGYPSEPRSNPSFSALGHLVAFAGTAVIPIRRLDDGRLLGTLLSLRDDLTGFVGRDGHWRGSPELERELVYVLQTAAGQTTLTSEKFSRRHGWKNDPEKTLAKGARPRDDAGR